jgi:hypothetical protein
MARGGGAHATGEHTTRIQIPGVVWERLHQASDPHVDFLRVEYKPGSSSCAREEATPQPAVPYLQVRSFRTVSS